MAARSTSPSFVGRQPASDRASRALQGASRKRDTQPELLLRRALFAQGLRYRVDARHLAGRPDIVFARVRLAVFVDGDFWHGRNLRSRIPRLARGHNPDYWTAKIRANIARDRRVDAALERLDWRVQRFWESDVRASPGAVAVRIAEVIERVKKSGIRGNKVVRRKLGP